MNQGAGGMRPGQVDAPVVAVLVALIFGLLIVVLTARFAWWLFRTWMKGRASGCPLTMMQVVAIWIRGNPIDLLVEAWAALVQRGVATSLEDVERAYIAGKGRLRTPSDIADAVMKRKDLGGVESGSL